AYRFDIFFNLSPENKNLYFERVMYDFNSNRLLAVRTWEIPLDELNVDNIEISEYHSRLFDMTLGNLTLTAENNNPNAFNFRMVTYDKEESVELTQCQTTRELTITTSAKKARELKYALEGFLNNLN